MADVSISLSSPVSKTLDPATAPRTGHAFPHRLRARVVAAMLGTADALAGTLTSLTGLWLAGWLGLPAPASWIMLPVLVVTFGALVGLYTAAGPSPFERFRLRVIASLCAVGLAFLSGGPAGFGDAALLEPAKAIMLIALGHYAETGLRTLLLRAGLWCAPTIVVNDNERGRQIVAALLGRPEIGLAPVGFVTDPETSTAVSTDDAARPLPLLGTIGERGERDARLDVQLDAEVVIFTSPRDLTRFLAQHRHDATVPRLLLFEDTSEIGSLWLRPRMLGDAIGIEIQWSRDRRASRMLKRIMDVALAAPLAVAALPVIAVTAGFIALADPGPVFYRQERVGRQGRPIKVLKLRSMYRDSEHRLQEHLAADPDARAEWERFFKLRSDPRILPLVGRFIRLSSIDELPQLWNVLRGDMSLVGPRPFPAYHMKAFDPQFQVLRTSVQPGLTGLWQISARSNGDIDVQRSQDLFYIRNRSLWLDCYILLQTLPAILIGNGAR